MVHWFFPFAFLDLLAYGAAGLLKALVFLGLVLFIAMLALWMERKIAGRIQDRLGPTRTGGRFGWLQSPADGLKLLMKEDLMPAAADPLLFRLAPYVSFGAAFCLFVVWPVADGWVPVQWDSALFFFLAVAGLEVFGVILAGYGSGSKWALFGAMREAAQVVSYEVPLGLCVVVPVLSAGTMDLVEIARLQEGWFTSWLIFHDPFTFFTFWIYAACVLAGVNRAPFDLPEAESELVAGFATEYSGFRWAVFFMAEYTAMFAWSGLGTIVFFGGWNGPVPVAAWLGLVPANGHLAAFSGNLLGMLNFLLKAFLGLTVMIWVRWSLPRLRIDQVIAMCWKYCVPLAAAMLTGAVLWQVLAVQLAPTALSVPHTSSELENYTPFPSSAPKEANLPSSSMPTRWENSPSSSTSAGRKENRREENLWLPYPAVMIRLGNLGGLLL